MTRRPFSGIARSIIREARPPPTQTTPSSVSEMAAVADGRASENPSVPETDSVSTRSRRTISVVGVVVPVVAVTASSPLPAHSSRSTPSSRTATARSTSR